MKPILIVEDEQLIRQALKKMLERNGYPAHTAESVEQAQAGHSFSDYQLVLADIRLPGKPGTQLIPLAAPVPVLMMTSYASVSSAVESMKLGAADYIAKPFDHAELLQRIAQVLQQQPAPTSSPEPAMIGKSAVMQQLFQRIGKVAPTDASVLILGESGTGKELVARAIHDQSSRAQEPFIIVNCAAIPEHLVESELFGHVKGAYTGAENAREGLILSAHKGTLFLDEIAELPLGIQAKLLRVLQNGELRQVGSEKVCHVDVRILAATNRNLQQMVDAQAFRADLYFRLQVVELTLPPLRERKSDIRLLAETFLERCCARSRNHRMRFCEDALHTMQNHNWPGNVRELENAIERAVILADGPLITTELLNLATQPVSQANKNTSLEDYFIRFIKENQQRMTETELAQKLGISRKTLWLKRQRLGLPRSGK